MTRGVEAVDVPLTPEGNSEAAKDKYLTEQFSGGYNGGFNSPKIEPPNLDLSKIPFQTLSVQVVLTCTWPFPKSMYGPNMQFTSDGDVRVPINPTCMF